ncbi:MAG TPA: hypothetical protein GX507_04130 [Clostridia bacterium]|nr:hypothetical protein [Clostridia bacterium]
MRISEDRLLDLLVDTSERMAVFAPLEEDGLVLLSPFTKDRAASWARPDSYVNTDNTPKDVLMPQTEPYLRFEGDGRRMAVSEVAVGPLRQTFVFGVRPCDVRAVELLDRVLIEGQFRDEMYARRRAGTLIAAVACSKPGPECFCGTMGISHLGPAVQMTETKEVDTPSGRQGGVSPENPGCDLIFYPALRGEAGDRAGTGAGGGCSDTAATNTQFIVVSITERGDNFLRENGGYFEASGPDDLDATVRRLKDTFSEDGPSSVTDGLSLDGLVPYLAGQFDNPYWAFVSRRCHSCGACTYVCPTCYCFAVVDAARIDRGVRSRCWDSCQFQEFLLMAAGHNPRPTKKERVRQRFLHKLQYYPEKYGDYMCVGCGRCVKKCPVGLHMTQVIYDLGCIREGVRVK